MKNISSKQLQELWHDFWLSKQHVYLPEGSLIGGKESTAMFTIAGMQQLIPYLSGKEHPLGKRVFNIQKCIRTVDIDEVGDASHLTFFNMMGNRSLGDYFKRESIQRSREFLIDVLGFDPKKLAVTVFEGDADTPRDEETAGYRKQVGMSEDRIAYMSADNNRRSPGPVGPCGPDTEIFYRVGKSKYPPKGSTPKSEENNWLEIWNNVFMEFYRSEEKEEIGMSEEKKKIDKKTEKIIGICIKLHKKYGNSLTEKQYQNLIADFLFQEGFSVDKEKKVEIIENKKSYGFRYIDLVVDKNIFIELKNNPNPIEIKKGFKQLRSYLNLHGGLVGLLINFGMDKLGINRLNNFLEKPLQTSGFPKYTLTKLPQSNVDTGMGFERMVKVLQEKETVFDTDIFAPLISLITTTLGISYQGNEKRCRIVADHIRAAFFLISHDILPSNEGRGYVLRRLIRRMYYNFMLLKPVSEKIFDAFVGHIVLLIDQLMETHQDAKAITVALIQETHQFQKTISHGQKLLDDLIQSSSKIAISGKQIFTLYDTFGFPLELSKEILEEHGLSVDREGFEKEMKAQQERSRAGSKDMFKQGIDWASHLEGIAPTQFLGYETLVSEKVQVLKDFEVKGQRILVFDVSPFYAEGGGQIGDRGVMLLDNGDKITIVQVQKYNGVFLHFVE